MLLHGDREQQSVCVPLKRLDIWGLNNLYESKLTLATEAQELDIIIDNLEKTFAQMHFC